MSAYRVPSYGRNNVLINETNGSLKVLRFSLLIVFQTTNKFLDDIYRFSKLGGRDICIMQIIRFYLTCMNADLGGKGYM